MAVEYQWSCIVGDGVTPNQNCTNGSVLWQFAPNESFNVSISEFNSLALEGFMLLAIVWGIAVIIKIAKEW